jgi:hypothetical protein
MLLLLLLLLFSDRLVLYLPPHPHSQVNVSVRRGAEDIQMLLTLLARLKLPCMLLLLLLPLCLPLRHAASKQLSLCARLLRTPRCLSHPLLVSSSMRLLLLLPLSDQRDHAQGC